MTVSFVKGFEPIWYVPDLVGKPASGAELFTYSSLNPTQKKATYYDSGGNFPQPNPIPANENGTFGPIYFAVDSANPLDNYYLVEYDQDGNLLWSDNNYSPSTSGGGGSSTNYVDIDNYIANNIMLNNIGDTNLSSFNFGITISPSNHQGFVYIGGASNGAVGPDMIFYKNVTTATDSISFPTFPAGLNPLTPDVTPPFYAEYVSTGTTGELQKYFQWPICKDVKNLANQPMTFTCWVKSGSSATSNIISFSFRQYFGAGGSPTPDNIYDISGSTTIGTDWQMLTFHFTVPAVTGTTIGDCGDDATYIQINMPRNISSDVCFTKPCLFLGTINPTVTFEDYDQINRDTTTGFRSGDVKTTVNVYHQGGWIPANNGTIGNTNSNASTRANSDTFPLFYFIWHACFFDQQYAPMYSSSGIAGAYGADAEVDFAANRQISLTKSLGQVFAGCTAFPLPSQTFTTNRSFSPANLNVSNASVFGTGSPVVLTNSGGSLPAGLSSGVIYYSIYVSNTILRLATSISNALSGTEVLFSTDGSGIQTVAIYNADVGVFLGENSHTLIPGELPNPLTSGLGVSSGTGGSNSLIESNNGSGSGIILNPGGGNGHNNIQPTTFMNVYFKL